MHFIDDKFIKPTKGQGPIVNSPNWVQAHSWTTPNPYIGLNESDSKLNTNFNFAKINHNILKTYLIYKLPSNP